MIILHGPSAVNSLADLSIRALISQRFSQILSGEPYDYDQHGYMIVVEPGDSIESLESETCCSILHNAFDDTHFGNSDFTPCFEALEEHSNCFEMLFILSDSGFGIELFIPKHSGINPDLLALCAEYAVPAMTAHT
ncbi:MAG: hypothetical protein U1D41_14605 [Nitrosomonas sp.]|uniref:hypothetical protein n=1 Tax=Nitrosomonas sp. TaxID=42353 RepID=UPI00276DB118|nr:hypothetical protein [Nitrosomonas sp.]MDP3609455.1 hypothetical protein [Methylophilus sp.]MDZ4107358.1 hypothetical protein [Nitrosomonas sp.]